MEPLGTSLLQYQEGQHFKLYYMGRLSVRNVKHSSPSWMVNLTGILAALTPILPGMINTMPGHVPQSIKDWLLWVLACITGVVGTATMFAKSKSDIVGGRPDDRNKP